MAMLRVVVAEDDAAVRELLVHHLSREGYRCIETGDGPATLRAVRAGSDLIVLDVGLPLVDGFEIVRTLRREGRAQPVVLLTARCDEVDRVLGLELGADDYVTKPFSPRELVARVRALLRRGGMSPERDVAGARTGALALRPPGGRRSRARGADRRPGGRGQSARVRAAVGARRQCRHGVLARGAAGTGLGL
jgi:two-component system OmpR family response regulator